MGFAFYPNDGAALRDAFQKQFPEYVIDLSPFVLVDANYVRVYLLTKVDGAVVACNSFQTAWMLDNCVISGALSVWFDYRNLGIGQRMMQAKIEWANRQHYTLLATIRDHNVVQKHILTKFGWHHVGADLWVYTPTKE